jgi:hypothetical protein
MNQSAFPISGSQYRHTEGMTLRDYFAAKAMQGLISCADWRENVDEHCMNDMEATQFTAITAYEMADAMLKAREA